MPTYDYQCERCGHRFEAFQSMTDKPLKKCPLCRASKVKRLIGGGAGIIFRGSGFYCTDYRKGSSSSSKESAADAKPKSEASSPAPKAKPDGGKKEN